MKFHPAGLVFLLLASGCDAQPRLVEGYYRFGHEVNVICTDEPENCYWLVDTAADVREALKRQVTGLAPYEPVCVRVEAQLSSQKADGFGRDYDGSISVKKLLGRCDEVASAAPVQPGDLWHRRWELHSVDNLGLNDFARSRGYAGEELSGSVPDLDFGDQNFVEGNTGCNQFHGEANVVEDELLLTLQASTEMACSGFGREIELELIMLYRVPLVVSLEGNQLILRAMDRELRYQLRDWVQ